MAYLAFNTIDAALPLAPIADPIPASTARDDRYADDARFGALEWSVIALARKDRLSSLRAPGRLSVALRAVMRQNNPRLADERLEALRRMAVLAWHQSFQVAASELRAFFDAGFTHGQYETMMASIAAARTQRHRRR
ncbi:hypothetical protein [Sphingomonas sp.]|jgi:hypothetical protein|uniref:hypothetical protein n=1 Tax=Sphingomonas sp. TaxID=28214 RepID=UPI002601D658|nr:hypothetical protein [Sphingomonas sp.]MDF2603099.1 hypothetical protein [Sphingomonas sp.]